jgi:hypothetical protein
VEECWNKYMAVGPSIQPGETFWDNKLKQEVLIRDLEHGVVEAVSRLPSEVFMALQKANKDNAIQDTDANAETCTM